MLEDIGVVGNKFACLTLYAQQSVHDGEAQILEPGSRLSRGIIDHAVDVALRVELERREAYVLGAFLPRQVQTPRDIGEPFGLNRAENAIAHRQNHVAGRQRNGAAGVAEPEDDAHVRHVDVAHLRNQPRNAVRLVVAVGLLLGISTGGVHQGDDRQRALRIHGYPTRSSEMMLRAPDAVADRPILRDEPDRSGLAFDIKLDRGRIERSVRLLVKHAAQLTNHLGGGNAARIFCPRNDGFDVGINIEPGQPLVLTQDLASRQQPGQGLVRGAGGEQREILGQRLRDAVQAIALKLGIFHGQRDSNKNCRYSNEATGQKQTRNPDQLL